MATIAPFPLKAEGPATYIVEFDGARCDVQAFSPALAVRVVTSQHPQANVTRVFIETLDFIWRDQK